MDTIMIVTTEVTHTMCVPHLIVRHTLHIIDTHQQDIMRLIVDITKHHAEKRLLRPDQAYIETEEIYHETVSGPNQTIDKMRA